MRRTPAQNPQNPQNPDGKGRAVDVCERAGVNAPRATPEAGYRRTEAKRQVARLAGAEDSAEREASAGATAQVLFGTVPSLADRLRRIDEQEAAEFEEFMGTLCGGLPEWAGRETRRRAKNAYLRLRREPFEFSDAQVLGFVALVAQDEDEAVPALSVEFLDAVNELAHVRYAVTLGPERGLAVLHSPDAAAGFKSRHAASKPRGEPWYVPFLREYVADVARGFGKRCPTLAEWTEAAQARSDDGEFWTRRGVEVYLSEDEKTGEPVVVVSKSGEHSETAATKTLKPKALYRYFPR